MLTLEAKVSAKQKQFIDSRKKYTIHSGGYGSSKSWGAIYKAFQYMVEYPGINIMFCSLTYPMIRDTIYNEWIKICPFTATRSVRSPMDYTIDNGSTAYFRSFDTEFKLKGFTLGAAFIAEGSHFPRENFQQLQGRIRQPGGMPLTIDIDTNPDSFDNWLYKDFIDPETSIDPDNTLVIYSTSHDNPFLPEDYLQRLDRMKITDPEYYDRNVLGKWGKLEGTIYDVPQDLRDIPEDFDPHVHICGVDFGFTHETAISPIGFDGQIFGVLEEMYRSKMTSQDIIKEVSELHEKYYFDYIYCDGARPEIIEEMVQEGLPAKPALKGPGSVFTGIMFIKSLHKSERLYYSKYCINHFKEIDSYIWDKNQKVKEVPIKKNDHLMDSHRYAIHTYSIENGLDVSPEDLYRMQAMLA